jgi:hypothetical protein
MILLEIVLHLSIRYSFLVSLFICLLNNAMHGVCIIFTICKITFHAFFFSLLLSVLQVRYTLCLDA